MQVIDRFGMHDDDVGTGCSKIRDIAVRIFDHQMHIQRQRGHPAGSLNDQRPDSDIGDEVSIHNIDVNIVGTGCFKGTNFITQAGEISRQDGWGDLFHVNLNLAYKLTYKTVSRKARKGAKKGKYG